MEGRFIMNIRQKYNDFFVTCFNMILKNEEAMLKSIDPKLSVTEIHVIDAIYSAGENNLSKKVAAALKVKAGTLTTSVDTLVKKGYVIKTQDKTDKRVARLSLTENGRVANETHLAFHKKMIDEIVDELTEVEADALINALVKLKNYLQNEREDNL